MEPGHDPPAGETTLRIPVAAGAALQARLAVPHGAGGLVVLFPDGKSSGAGGTVADELVPALHQAGVATLCVPCRDGEAAAAAGDARRLEIGAMAERLASVMEWASRDAGTRAFPLGCLATGTAAAAALKVARSRKALRALVLLEGRPDLAGAAVEAVRVPVLLVVPGLDAPLLQANHRVLRRLGGPAMLEVVPGALHGFREPEERAMAVARAADWFGTHLGTREPARGGTPPGGTRRPLFELP
jgi:putative phosphoribosyl transferase